MDSPFDAHTRTLLSALAPSEHRGTSALVSGSSARARATLLHAVATEYAALHPSQVVVEVSAIAARQGRLGAVDAAIDEALSQRGAPASSGDEDTVAAWLYRARAAGASGIMLVVHDVDAIVDVRGGASHAARFRALVDAVARGPWCVLASVRAVSAAGAPGLARELTDSFGTIVALGGPPAVVTRDPSSLAPVLAGRTFHASGVRAAVTAWLSLPPPRDGADDDDTVVVFSSPLAPPMLPLDPAITVAWERVRVDAPLITDAVRSDTPVTAHEASRWSSGLRAAVRASATARMLRNAPLDTIDAMLDAYRRWYVPLCSDLMSATELGEDIGVALPSFRSSCEAAIARFAARAEATLCVVEGGTVDVERVGDVSARLRSHAEKINARSVVFVSLPGLGANAWRALRDGVLARVSGLVGVNEGLAWSLPDAREPFEGDVGEVLRVHREGHEVLRVGAYTREGAEAAFVAVLPTIVASFVGTTAVAFASEWGADGLRAGPRAPGVVFAPWAIYTYAARTP